MNDDHTIRQIQAICESRDVRRLWDQRTIKALARLPEGQLRAALASIRFHFGADCQPRLLARAVREERKRYLDCLQRIAVKPLTANGTKLDRGARLWARAGGLRRGIAKGFAGMDLETYARVQPMGTAAASQRAAQRRAAAAPLAEGLLPTGARLPTGGRLPAFWWTDKPATMPAASDARVEAPTAAVPQGRSHGAPQAVANVTPATAPARVHSGRVHSFEPWLNTAFCRVCNKTEPEGFHRYAE